MAQIERRQGRTVTVDLGEPTEEWLTSPPHTYHIANYKFEGVFDFGFQSLDSSPPHPDVIPEQIYLTLSQRLESELNLDIVRANTTEDTAPTVGRCTITTNDDDELQATIDLVDHFLDA